MNDLIKRLEIKAGMIEMGERIAWGSDSALMREAANHINALRTALEQAEMDINVLYLSLNKKDEHIAFTALERIRKALGAA